MTDLELMQQALEALEQVSEYFSADSTEAKTITDLRERLAQPYPDNFIDALKYDVARRDSETAQQDYWQEEARRYAQNADFWRVKYEAATAQRKPLTDEEIWALHDGYLNPVEFARAIEAKLKEKNT